MLKTIFRLTAVFIFFGCYEFHKISNEELRASKNLKIVPKTPGRPFPKPQSQVITDVQQLLDEKNFSFQYGKGSVVCDVLSVAFKRYYDIIFRPQNIATNVRKIARSHKDSETKINPKASLIKKVTMNVQEPCEDYPSLDSDESC